MLKLILCVTLVLSSTVIGFSYSNRLYQRKKVLESFVLELKNCSTQMRYTSYSLSQIFSDNFMGYKFTDDKPFVLQWADMLNSYTNILSPDDILVLKNFSQTLGTSDTLGEQNHIDMYMELLKANIANAEHDIEQKSKLYKTLGLSLGLVIAILII